MSNKEVQQLDALRAQVASRRAALVVAREKLIEALGDRMCGSGSGPSPGDIKNFEQLQKGAAEADRALERFLLDRARSSVKNAQRGVHRGRLRRPES